MHCLSLKLHLYYRDALLAFKCMNSCAPIYLSSQLITCRGEMSSRETRNVRYLDVPLYKTATGKEHSIIEPSRTRTYTAGQKDSKQLNLEFNEVMKDIWRTT
jgi:hypothetical protein